MFIWIPYGQGTEYVSNDLSMVLAYIVPEIIPSLLQVFRFCVAYVLDVILIACNCAK
jgi:hypothetical protein